MFYTKMVSGTFFMIILYRNKIIIHINVFLRVMILLQYHNFHYIFLNNKKRKCKFIYLFIYWKTGYSHNHSRPMLFYIWTRSLHWCNCRCRNDENWICIILDTHFNKILFIIRLWLTIFCQKNLCFIFRQIHSLCSYLAKQNEN